MNTFEHQVGEMFKSITIPTYVLYNLYLPYVRGITEVDLVAITPYGVYVVEAKDYHARITGMPSDKKWVATYPNKEQHYFYNPIKQNEAHAAGMVRTKLVTPQEISSMVIFSNGAILDPLTRVFSLQSAKAYCTEQYVHNTNRLTEPRMLELYRALWYYTMPTVAQKKQHLQLLDRAKRKYNG